MKKKEEQQKEEEEEENNNKNSNFHLAHSRIPDQKKHLEYQFIIKFLSNQLTWIFR